MTKKSESMKSEKSVREISVHLSDVDGRLVRQVKFGSSGWRRPFDESKVDDFTARLGRLTPSDRDYGHTLFEILFGTDPAARDEFFREVFGRPKGAPPQPHAQALRVRIDAADGLRDFDWMWTSFDDRRLIASGWRFEQFSRVVSPRLENIEFDIPGVLIVCCPPTKESPERNHMLADVKEYLREKWGQSLYDDRVHIVETAKNLDAKLKSERATGMLWLGPHEVADGQLILRFGDDDGKRPAPRLSAEQLAAKLENSQLRLFCLVANGRPLATSAFFPLHNHVPCVVGIRRSGNDKESRNDVLDLVGRFFGPEFLPDPVDAVHDHRRNGDPRYHGTVWTSYRRFASRWLGDAPKTGQARKWLDRLPIRRWADGSFRDMPVGRSLIAGLVVGHHGAHVRGVGQQCVEYIRRNNPHADVQSRLLRMPSKPGWTKESVDEAVRRDGFSIGEDDAIKDVFLEILPISKASRSASARPRYLILDCEVKSSKGQPPIAVKDLEVWAEYCASELTAPARAAQLKVICMLAVEGDDADIKHYQSVSATIHKKAWYREATGFRFEVSEPLSKVTASDLTDFLSVAENSSCPQSYLADMPELIVENTDGVFEVVCDMIDEAERSGWRKLHRDLTENSRENGASA